MNYKFFAAAKLAAIQGVGANGRGHNKFKLGAALTHKNMLISTGSNSYKTHPLMHRRTEWPFLHAEQSAIIRNGIDNCEGRDLYVVRILKNLDYATSYPCEVCQQLIKDVGVRNVFYIDERGEFAKWNPLMFI
jgi:deoxycytidylate deaminase